MECLFCRIAGGEIPAHTVFEDGATRAFLDVHPVALGHTVVVAKHHSETLLDLPESDLAALFRTVQRVSGMVTGALRADGLTIGINQGKVSGQSVPHLHVHIIPRFAGDGGGSIHSVVHHPPEQPLEETVERITHYHL